MKKLSALNPLLATVIVSGVRERGNVVLGWRAWRSARHDVENWLRAHVWNGGAANVFEAQRQRSSLVAYSSLFSGKELRPTPVILDEADDIGFKTEGMKHRCRLTDRTQVLLALPQIEQQLRPLNDRSYGNAPAAAIADARLLDNTPVCSSQLRVPVGDPEVLLDGVRDRVDRLVDKFVRVGVPLLLARGRRWLFMRL
jgi:hypothetical protein